MLIALPLCVTMCMTPTGLPPGNRCPDLLICPEPPLCLSAILFLALQLGELHKENTQRVGAVCLRSITNDAAMVIRFPIFYYRLIFSLCQPKKEHLFVISLSTLVNALEQYIIPSVTCFDPHPYTQTFSFCCDLSR